MSTLVLKQDHAKFGKKGARVTVSFLEGRDLVAAGLAERWNGGKAAPAEAPPSVSMETYEKAGRRIVELESQVKALQAEIDSNAKAQTKAIEDAEKLKKEVASLTEQLTAARAAAGQKKDK